MPDTMTLGSIRAPSGAVVLGCGGHLDEWADFGEPLSSRARRAAGTGGAHLKDGLAEAIAVPVGTGPLTVTATTRPGAYALAEAIAVLEVALGLPWSAVSEQPDSVLLGELPVDTGGMIIGDPIALDSWVGTVSPSATVDGLADVLVRGDGSEQAQAEFGSQPIPAFRAGGPHGWLDLPVDAAYEQAATVNRWAVVQGHYKYLAKVELHTHHHLGQRAGWPHALGAGTIEVAGCPVLAVHWDPAELQRFDGGQSHPVSLENVAGSAVLRWTLPLASATSAAS
ncbi:hypothetical protein HDA40_000645 [Hamadaea flava]|uniref:Uncharacterized protein n=1 Tax=Hamadaea flava TaxID=1742688 RepID=A0ABV8M0T3_9ACTN|nr:hypothetical protein [Hamadaea flava]MCP2322138.1 hypothetical protein [Hamadaea flava]